MNIGIVTTWFERGAAYVSRQYRDVLQGPHEVFVYARGDEKLAIGDPNWDDKRVTWAKGNNPLITTHVNARHFKQWIVENSIDVVFFNEQHWWEPVLLCNAMGIKTGAYIDYYTEETIPLFAAYDFLICNTRRHYSAFDWHPQAYYIPWGTDLSLFCPQSGNPAKAGSLTFFHSCGWNPLRKGTDLVLLAFAAVTGPARLVVHSQVDLDLSMPELRPLLQRLRNEDRFICRQETITAPGLYHLGDVYVYPSRLEGIGLTLAEALACGLPIITCNQPPMSEFLHESCGKGIAVSRLYARSDGYYWPQCTADLPNLTQCMQEYVDALGEIGRMKKQARLYAEDYLSWKNNSVPLVEIFAGSIIRRGAEKIRSESKVREYHEKHWVTGRPLASVVYRVRRLMGHMKGSAYGKY